MNLNTPERAPARIADEAARSPIYWEELAILDFTHEILNRMKILNWSKTNLAEKLEVEPAYVSKLIGGSNNFTLRTMVKLARALDAELRFHLQPTGKQTMWIDCAITQHYQETTATISSPRSKAADFKQTPNVTQIPAGNNEALLSAA